MVSVISKTMKYKPLTELERQRAILWLLQDLAKTRRKHESNKPTKK